MFSFEGTNLQRISGDNSAEVTPVPIPNTEVKLCNAEDTWWVTARENRSLPEYVTEYKVQRQDNLIFALCALYIKQHICTMHF